MSIVAPVSEVRRAAPPSTAAKPSLAGLATTLEILLVYSGILLYIWRWQYNHPRVWMALLAAILVSHLAHRDTPRTLGLSLAGLRSNAQFVLPVVAAVYVGLTALAFARHTLMLLVPNRQAMVWFAGYGVWAAVQQYLAQSYFHNRLMSVIQNRHLSSALVAIMFGGAHIPNPVLMIAATIGEFIFSEAFARHRNIWPLALAHTAGGFLVAAISPVSLIHNMRVGPGYYFYQLYRLRP